MVTQYIMHVTLQTHTYITMVTQHTHVDIHHHGDAVPHITYCKHTVTQYHVLSTFACVTICILMYVRICLHSNMHILRRHGDACICKVPYLMIAKLLFCGFN